MADYGPWGDSSESGTYRQWCAKKGIEPLLCDKHSDGTTHAHDEYTCAQWEARSR